MSKLTSITYGALVAIAAMFLLVGALASVGSASHGEPTCGYFLAETDHPYPVDPNAARITRDSVVHVWIPRPDVTPERIGESWTVEYKKGQIYHIDVDGYQHKADRDGLPVTFHK